MINASGKDIRELNPEELDQVSGGVVSAIPLQNWMKAHPNYANEATRLFISQGKYAAGTYVQQLIEEYQLPAEWYAAVPDVVVRLYLETGKGR